MGKSRHVVIPGLVVACALVMFPGSAGATLYGVYKGSLTGGYGLYGNDGWSASTLSWEVLWDTSKLNTTTNEYGLWKYTYTFTSSPKSKNVSHYLIETSGDFAEDDLMYWKEGLTPQIKSYKTDDPGSASPGLPSSLYGIKFNVEGDTDPNSVWFWTDRSPVWGDWYAKDGTDGGVDAYAYNRGFGKDPEYPNGDDVDWWCAPAAPVGGQWSDGVPDVYGGETGWVLNSNWNYVLRPDTAITSDDPGGGQEVPEPNIGLLLLLGIVPIGIGMRLRRTRAHS